VEDDSVKVGVLLARVWFQGRTLVARVTTTPDVEAQEPVSVVVATRRALHQEIDRWLHEMGYRGNEESGDDRQVE
jgi:hypothetical protein